MQMYNLIVITDPQSKCCHTAVIWLGEKKKQNKYYFWLVRLFTGWGEAGAVPIRKPGPVWSSVITRCPLATSLRASTQEKCYLPETQDLSYLCNDNPRRKANNASMPSLKSLLKARRVEPSIEKSFLTRYIVLSTSKHTTKGSARSGVLTHGERWVTRSTAAQGTKRRK